jgi:hypothetical protein
MNNPNWRAVVIALEYGVQFCPDTELNSPDGRRQLFNLVWYSRVYPFSVDNTRRALQFLQSRTDIDIASFLPQPHSDRTLRQAFTRLYQTLSKLPI